ncbi:MAG TPA: DUF1801 domain-containing protein [Acidimicrobiia bacterium]
MPDVGERISYQIPTFTVGGRYLVYAGAWKTHVGIYPCREATQTSMRRWRPTAPARGRSGSHSTSRCPGH